MKRIFCLLLITVLFFSVPLKAMTVAETETSFSVISAYYKDGKICVLLDLKNEPDLLSSRFNVARNDGTIPNEDDQVPVNLTNTDFHINYMLLVDASTSMEKFKADIKVLAESLLDNGKNDAVCSVATFGEKFTLVESGTDDPKTIYSVIDNLVYNEEATEICEGLIEAFGYISDHEMKKHEMYEIILITDGEPYIAESENHREELESSINQLSNTIVKTPEVTLHSVCFGNWNINVWDAVSKGTGLHQTTDSQLSPTAAGKCIADFSNNLYVIEMFWSADKYDKRLSTNLKCIDTHETVSLGYLRNYDQANFQFLPFGLDETSKIVSSDENNTETSEAEQISETVSEPSGENTEKTSEGSKQETNNTGNYFPFLIIIIILVIIVIILIALLLVKNKKQNHPTEKTKSIPESSVKLTIRMIRGRCNVLSSDILFNGELLIGNGEDCDIILEDNSISSKNTRVFIQDGYIYIEDLNEISNTYLEGMKIFVPNRLRSGDEISVGNTVFKLLF